MHYLAKNTLLAASIAAATVTAAFSQNKAPIKNVADNAYAYRGHKIEVPPELEEIAANNDRKAWVRYESVDHRDTLQIFLTVSAEDGFLSKKTNRSINSEEITGFNLEIISKGNEKDPCSLKTIAQVQPDGSVKLHHFQSSSGEVTRNSVPSILDVNRITPILLNLGVNASKNKL